MKRLIHSFTDLLLALLVGLPVGAAVAAGVIFGVSREQGFPKHIANTLAGTMFERLGWPVALAACLAALGCLFAAHQPPVGVIPARGTRLAWKAMGGLALLLPACALATQLHFAPLMHDLRLHSRWEDGALVDPAEQAAFSRAHGLSMAVGMLGPGAAALLVLGRRLFAPLPVARA
ncbi:MAG: hypothetical protein IT463_10880 [Planctomycetes bacterium]|nr:hypothetical protein [Planctomycetota bacterium]